MIIDSNQILIVSITTVMTILLTLVGIELILVLKEARKFLIRANSVLDEIEKVGFGLNQGYSEIKGFVSGIVKIFKIIDILSKKRKKI